MNAYIELLKQAQEKQWCIQEFCTTCGSMEFRNAATHTAGTEVNIHQTASITPMVLVAPILTRKFMLCLRDEYEIQTFLQFSIYIYSQST